MNKSLMNTISVNPSHPRHLRADIPVISILVMSLLVLGCNRRNNPNLPEAMLKSLFADTASTRSRQEVSGEPADTFRLPQAGIKYKEQRRVDPAKPPVVINVEQAMSQIKTVPLSRIGKKIDYIPIIIPDDMRVHDYILRNDTLFVSCRNQMATKQYILPYHTNGDFLHLVWEVTPKATIKKTFGSITTGQEVVPATGQESSKPPPPLFREHSSDTIMFNVDFGFGGDYLLYTVIERGSKNYTKRVAYSLTQGIKYELIETYDRARPHITEFIPSIGWALQYRTANSWLKKEPFGLYVLSFYGDTLCRFTNHTPFTSFRAGAFSNPEKDNVYFFNNHYTFRSNYSDTIFYLQPPGLIVPAYVFRQGKYKLNATEGMKGEKEGKIAIKDIKETRSLLFTLLDTPPSVERKMTERVLFLDKKTNQAVMNESSRFINDIDEGPEFYPGKVMPDGQAIACLFTADELIKLPSAFVRQYFPTIYKNHVLFMIVR